MSRDRSTPEEMLEDAERLRHILDKRADGRPWDEIARDLGLSVTSCHRIIREAAELSNRRNAQLVDEMRLTHHARCEKLYRTVLERIQVQIDAGHLDDKLVRAAVVVLDRQARLLGLDAVRVRGGTGRNDWVDDMPIGAVLDEAARMGLKVPKELLTGGLPS